MVFSCALYPLFYLPGPSLFVIPHAGQRLALLTAISENDHRFCGRTAYIVQVTVWVCKESTSEVNTGAFYS